MKVNKHMALDHELNEKLIEESKKPDKTQISIIEYALKAYFDLRIIAPKETDNEKS